TRVSLSSAVNAELAEKSEVNAIQIQQIFQAAGSVASDMQSYLESTYKTANNNPEQMVLPTDTAIMALYQSSLYHQTLAPLNLYVEQYLTETARNITNNNDNIMGVGVMFEPYKFQNDINSYAFYIDKSTVGDAVKPFGEYAAYSIQNYYKEASNTKQAIITDPYEYNGKTMITYSTPILYNGELQGVVMADINLDSFNQIEATSERYPSMYAIIYDNTGTVVYGSTSDATIGKTIADYTPIASELETLRSEMSNGQAFHIEATRENGESYDRFFYPIEAGSETWWALTAVSSNDVNKSASLVVLLLEIACAAVLLILIVATVLVLRKMLRPMQAVVQAAESISRGNLDVEIQHFSQDEIGILSESFRKMAGNLKVIINDIGYLLGEMAQGNFDIRARSEEIYVGEYHEILLSMRKMHRKMNETLHKFSQSAEMVDAGAVQVSDGAQALSQGTTEQAASVEELAATINEISRQVTDTAASAQKAIQKTQDTGMQVARSNQQMQEMLSAMSEITQSSHEIGKIIKTIEDIAFQTNILALNAAVEAARAGNAGKGFAVVADEVRNLAGKSAAASKSTSELIEHSLRAVENGSHLAGETAQALQKVVKGAEEVTDAIDNISKAASEQAAAIAQVTSGVDQISAVIQTNSATAEESAAASEELSSQASTLKEVVSQFKYRIDIDQHIR
ncbi:MAG TPA: methyl-accepting chemotaxis protein, partial [Clostridia bacterium]|nr:methyl-accepting chemotaxis protein [Clostridia bacterium]